MNIGKSRKRFIGSRIFGAKVGIIVLAGKWEYEGFAYPGNADGEKVTFVILNGI